MRHGGYMDFGGDWWAPSGQIFFSPELFDSPEQEAEYARAHFFIPRRFRDPFATVDKPTDRFVTYDRYDLLPLETRDALGNRETAGERNVEPSLPLVRSGLDYRVLQPYLVMGANRNRTMVAYDEFGIVVGSAVMGAPEKSEGDNLDGFNPLLQPHWIHAYFQDPLEHSQDLVGNATTRFVYDLWAYHRTSEHQFPQPTAMSMISRETHVSMSTSSCSAEAKLKISYFDGKGSSIQQKMPEDRRTITEPEDKRKVSSDPCGQSARYKQWIASGWTIYNNKGNPVRTYEPFFTDSHRFQYGTSVGVSSISFYDPMQRVIAALHPDHTWTKVRYDPWTTQSWDVNDNILVSDPSQDKDVGDFFRGLNASEYLPSWYDQRISGELGIHAKNAALKSAVFSELPSFAFIDPQGQTFATVTRNTTKYNDGPVQTIVIRTRKELDISGNTRQVLDAKSRLIATFEFDMLGQVISQAGMETGRRWKLDNVAGDHFFSWDSEGCRQRTCYDQLHRPISTHLKRGSSLEAMTSRREYGETMMGVSDLVNSKGRLVRLFDQAGVLTTAKYDFKANSLTTQRQFTTEYRETIDWNNHVMLDCSKYTSRTAYDALNRVTHMTTPDLSTISYTYNRTGLLNSTFARLRTSMEPVPYVTGVEYNAQGMWTSVTLANGLRTSYSYDPKTFRLISLTTRALSVDTLKPPLQDFRYTYDPKGNIVHMHNGAQTTQYFRNQRVDAGSDFTYDAMSQVVEATGREQLGKRHPNLTFAHAYHTRVDHVNNGEALARYLQQFTYDETGNIVMIKHKSDDALQCGWTRQYRYNEPSQLDHEVTSDRLSETKIGNVSQVYRYDGNAGRQGSMTSMPGLSLMQWNQDDQLRCTAKQEENSDGSGKTWYVYDAGGLRVREVTERPSQTGQAPALLKERFYIGNFELFRKYAGDGTVRLERESLGIRTDTGCIAMVETRTVGVEQHGIPIQLTRFQLPDKLGSITLEVDELGKIVSYEEFYPFGESSYERKDTEVPKRYRYTGKEHDEENGLYYYGARYYAAFLGRWTSADPIGLQGGSNLYAYVKNNPINAADAVGHAGPNSNEDLFTALKSQASFEVGSSNPPVIDVNAARTNSGPFGQAVESRLDGTDGNGPGVLMSFQQEGVSGSENIYSNVVVDPANGHEIVSISQGPSGAPK